MTVAKVLVLAFGAGALATMMAARDPDPILLTEATAAPTGDTTAAVFLRIENRGTPDRLLSVTSSSGTATLYAPETDNGVPSPTGPGAQLAADGAHIQLQNVSLAHGQLIPLTLTFANAGEVTAKARLIDPKADGGATEVGLFGIGGICQVGEGEPAPAISLRTEPDGDGWRIFVGTDEFTFSDERTGLFHVPGEGHGHLYVGGMKMGRLYAPEARIGALPPGRHVVRVTLNTNDHRAYVVGDDPVTATAIIDVPAT